LNVVTYIKFITIWQSGGWIKTDKQPHTCTLIVHQQLLLKSKTE